MTATITTATAATQAGVTIATIRTWCRYGAIAATKTAGRWAISAASLARRIAIGKERRMTTQPLPTLDEAVAEFHRWEKEGKALSQERRRLRREHPSGWIAQVRTLGRRVALCSQARTNWYLAVEAIHRGDSAEDIAHYVRLARDYAQQAGQANP